MGSYFGGPDMLPPSLVISAGRKNPRLSPMDPLGMPEEKHFRFWLAAPYFAAAFSTPELCSAADAPPGEVALTCLGRKAQPATIRARVQDRAVVVEVDGAQPTRLELDDPDACPELVSAFERRDLEPLRRAWANDAPSERCASARPGKSVVRARFHLDVASAPPSSSASSGPAACSAPTTIALLVDRAPPKPLGDFANLCGMCRVTRFTDVNALELGCSDMDLSRRFAYQLGDAVYVTSGEQRVDRVELPCGARAKLGTTGPKRDEQTRALLD